MSLKKQETRIRNAAKRMGECGLEIGKALIEIETDGDWRETEYDSFDEYLKGEAEALTGKGQHRCRDLMRAAVVSVHVCRDVSTNMGASHLQEVAKLAPMGNEPGKQGQGRKITKKDAAVMQEAIERSQEIAEQAGKKSPSVRDVRKAVRETQDARDGVNREQRDARDATDAKSLAILETRQMVKSTHAKLLRCKLHVENANVSLVKRKEVRKTIADMMQTMEELYEFVQIHNPQTMEERS